MTTTPEVHRAHVEELRNLAKQIRDAHALGYDHQRAIADRLAAVDYAIEVLTANPPGRHLSVVVADEGKAGDGGPPSPPTRDWEEYKDHS